MIKTKAQEKGFVSFILLLIIALIALKYFFDWSILDAAKTSQGQNTLNYVKEIFVTAWNWIVNLVRK